MTQEEIVKIREKYPISFDEITKFSSFEQILGRDISTYTTEEKKRRWQKAMSFSKIMKKFWSNMEACENCIHLNKKEAWCNTCNLPCTVNPVLSFTFGYIGMACCGIEKEEIKTLFD